MRVSTKTIAVVTFCAAWAIACGGTTADSGTSSASGLDAGAGGTEMGVAGSRRAAVVPWMREARTPCRGRSRRRQRRERVRLHRRGVWWHRRRRRVYPSLRSRRRIRVLGGQEGRPLAGAILVRRRGVSEQRFGRARRFRIDYYHVLPFSRRT